MDELMDSAGEISLFCRTYINLNKTLTIRSSEMGLLIFLVKAEGEKTPIEIANFFHFSKSMSTNMVTVLTKKGYIEKKRSKFDKRNIILIPTEKAIKLVDETYNEYFKVISVLKYGMGENFDELIKLLKQANKILIENRGI
ncbi:MarR family winged helix-turn-helix transcriptional regulator [Companilactobacillus sp. DQM5]|uniref:MarR family winged helix-turn-helix transcriptional regulator n=1 Tax=Companilactobacillus sp. DQM5 TaxID=3463359 RepID=UPI00405932A1